MIQLVGRDIAIEIEEEEDDAPPSDRNADKEESGVEEEVAGGSGPGHVRNLPQEDGSSSSPTPWLAAPATQASSETAPRFRKYESCSGERVR